MPLAIPEKGRTFSEIMVIRSAPGRFLSNAVLELRHDFLLFSKTWRELAGMRMWLFCNTRSKSHRLIALGFDRHPLGE
jgi:hypothetical protein